MAKMAEQLKIQVADKVGKLAEITDALKKAGVNIIAANAWVQEGQGFMYLVADDADKAAKALDPVTDRVDCAGQAVCVNIPNTAGALNEIAAKLAGAGIAVKLCYATTAGGEAMIILDTSDNTKAADLI
ncbi:unnamed protein product [marine sediment metagenome]|uniref:ACT domain-containing protein n=1 Tax=marine sediment metagenome TaxID=412755 RepID=X0UAS0_9ZZZZ